MAQKVISENKVLLWYVIILALALLCSSCGGVRWGCTNSKYQTRVK